MKNLKMVKKLLIILLSLVMVLAYSNIAFAADESDSLFSDFEPVAEEPTTTTENPTSGTNTNDANNTNTNNNSNQSAGISSSNGTNNNTNNNTNLTNTNNANVLADTGLSNTGSIVAIVLVVLGISAIYSYKKVSDYRKI